MASRRPYPGGLQRHQDSAQSPGHGPCKLARMEKSVSAKKPAWSFLEKKALVEFIALHSDCATSVWPGYRAEHHFWKLAAEYISKKAGVTIRTNSAVRVLCSKELKNKFKTLDDAEAHFGIDYADASDDPPAPTTHALPEHKPSPQPLPSPIDALLSLDLDDLLQCMDDIFIQTCRKHGLKASDRKYVSTLYHAMSVLETNKKPNVVASLAEVVAFNKIPLNRMPWGLIEYQVEFFNSTHVMQLSIPEDLAQWTESVLSQSRGSTVLLKILRGPMWSGYNTSDRGKIALDKALSVLPKDRHYWIKIDGTDIKPAVLESTRGEWSGDVDLGDGQLLQLRNDYNGRLHQLRYAKTATDIGTILESFKEDVIFLAHGHREASDACRKKMQQKGVGTEVVKQLVWNCLEYQDLLRIAHVFVSDLTEISCTCPEVVRSYLKDSRPAMLEFLRNLFKKKRTPASHVLVIMLANEERREKPYSIPIQYIPYASLRDQYLRDILVRIKTEMTERGFKVQGVVTDGEFHTLRTRGDTRSLHLWQLIHDAKDAVRKLSAATLQKMLVPSRVNPETGLMYAELQSATIPQDVLRQVLNLLQEGNTFPEVVEILRRQLVPAGYEVHPFHPDQDETLLDQMRSIVGTYHFRRTVQDYLAEGVDFCTYLYNPEIDPTTGHVIHERSDHNHLLKRIASSTRAGKYNQLNLEAFDEAVMDKSSGLTHAALVGVRKQSVPDAERLLSYQMADFMQRKGYQVEALYIQRVARWHEASDGRGLSQIERCKANYEMLNYILDEWMPWHRQNYDFSTIDINRPMTNIRGFTYQTLIEVTCNIESQEMRRRENTQRGFAEHPRAATTDDNECLFSLCRRHLAGQFTLQEFAAAFPRIVREFVRRTDKELPFYYHTTDERFNLEQENFDMHEVEEEDHSYHVPVKPLRLHHTKRSRREDSSIIVPGRSFLPVKNQVHLRARFYAPPVGLPPHPQNVLN